MPVIPEFTGTPADVISSATAAEAVVPSDATVLSFSALYVGTSGDVSVKMADATDVIYPAVQGGTILSVAGIGVNATGTFSGAARTGIVWLTW